MIFLILFLFIFLSINNKNLKMGCVNSNYCSCGSNIAIIKDKPYTTNISSNLLPNQAFSNKTNSKLLLSNSTQRRSSYIDYNCQTNNQSIDGGYNLDRQIVKNPLPFVKLIPKKIFY